MDCGLRLDFLVDNQVIVELKAVEKLHPVQKSQTLTYLRAPLKIVFGHELTL